MYESTMAPCTKFDVAEFETSEHWQYSEKANKSLLVRIRDVFWTAFGVIHVKKRDHEMWNPVTKIYRPTMEKRGYRFSSADKGNRFGSVDKREVIESTELSQMREE